MMKQVPGFLEDFGHERQSEASICEQPVIVSVMGQMAITVVGHEDTELGLHGDLQYT